MALLRRCVAHAQRSGDIERTLTSTIEEGMLLVCESIQQRLGPAPEGDVKLRVGPRLST